jgi:hypothetical protein
VAPRLVLNAGVATFDGHPDYQRLVEAAEAAMVSGAGDRSA